MQHERSGRHARAEADDQHRLRIRVEQRRQMCPSMRCSRMSWGSVEASTLPLTWNCTAPSSHCEIAMDELMPSPA